MNRTASISVKGLNLKYIKENITFLGLLLFVLIALLLGVLTAKNSTYFELSANEFENYIKIRSSNTFGEALLNVIVISLKIPVFSFLCGTSLLGLVISPLLLFYTAFQYGMLSSYIYSSFGLSGIVFNLFVLLLPQVIILFCLLFSSLECINFSKKIASICIKDCRPVNLYQDFKMFSIKHIILIIPLLFSSLLDVSLFKLLQNYINF